MSLLKERMRDFVKDFVEVRCCGESAGFVNPRPFTAEASARFCAIQQQLGNAWIDDTEAKALLADPASFGPVPDGTPIAFTCGRCGAHFKWAHGAPVRVAAS